MRERIGLWVGLALFVGALLLPAPAGMPDPAWRATGVALLMATWWVSEAIPIPATALLPLVLFPLLGILSLTDAAAPYANPVIYLFMGGFLLAAALERSGLHRRLALAIIRAGGTQRYVATGVLENLGSWTNRRYSGTYTHGDESGTFMVTLN